MERTKYFRLLGFYAEFLGGPDFVFGGLGFFGGGGVLGLSEGGEETLFGGGGLSGRSGGGLSAGEEGGGGGGGGSDSRHFIHSIVRKKIPEILIGTEIFLLSIFYTF